MTHNTNSKRAETLALALCALSLVFTAFAVYLGCLWARSRILQCAVVPLVVAAIYSILAWWHRFLVRRETEEADEHRRLREQYERNDLFDERDEGLKLAAHAHRNHDRFFLPVFTAIGGAVLLLVIWSLWRDWASSELPANFSRDALGAAGLGFFMAVFCLLSGSYANGLSREAGCRFLRPVAAWHLLTFAIYLIGVGTMLAEHFGYAAWDVAAGRTGLVALGILGAELLVNVVMEFYRPRSREEAERPLYESRLLALVTEPGGVARNVAHALDYQFGFEVSETWFYQFIESAVLPCVLVLLLALYLLDCVVLIDAGEVGVRERFGRPVAELQPGLHLKWVRPFERIRRVRVKQIRTVNVGFQEVDENDNQAPPPPMDEERQGDATARVIVWNKTHYHSETKFLVAAGEQARHGLGALGATDAVPVNFLIANIAVHYRVAPSAVRAFLYNYDDPAAVLARAAQREVVLYLASTDMVPLLGPERLQAQKALQQRVERAVSQVSPPLGLEVVFVGLLGVHPPVDVADSFQAVVGAEEQRRTTELNAKQYAVRQKNESQGRSEQLRLTAAGYRYRVTTVSEAEVERFDQQLKAYQVSPQVFKERMFLDMMETEGARLRKYISTTGDANRVFVFDLQKRLRPDLLQDLNLNAPDK